MTMTAEEIVREYKEARYPEKQIRILADQNSCGVSNIREILLAAGCELPRSRKSKAEIQDKDAGAWKVFDPKTKALEKPEALDLPFLPPPAGAGEFQDEAAQTEKGPNAVTAPVLASGEKTTEVRPAEAQDDDTISAGEVLPLIMRTSAVDVIARLLKDTRKTPEGYTAFTEQVRGVLALCHEVEHRAEELRN